MAKIAKVSTTSENIENENLQKLRKVFPNFVKDGEVDFDALQNFFNKEGFLAEQEKFGLNWAGKSDAFKAIRVPATGTLVPKEKESVNWDTTQNLFIEGDNLEVLKLLQKHYREKIKMIYIDPPYNTGKDFIYKDNFTENVSDYYERTGQSKDGIKLTSNPESAGRYHSDWLTMMYPRLFLARNLLKDDGVIFISIDEHEVHNLRSICEEIFGGENYTGDIIWKNSSKNDQDYVSTQHEYFLSFVKNKNANKGEWLEKKEGLDEIYRAFEGFRKKYGNNWEKIHEEALEWYKEFPESNPIFASKHYSWMDERGVYFPADISGPNFGQYRFDVIHPKTGKICKEPASGWRFPEQTMKERIQENLVHFGKDETTIPNNKTYLKDTEYQSLTSIKYKDGRIASNLLSRLMGGDYFTNPKDIDLLNIIFKAIGLTENDTILDFFAGSGTTAQAVMTLNKEDKKNRRFICVQLPQALDPEKKDDKAAFKFLKSINKPTNIAELCKERIRRASNQIKEGDIGFKILSLTKSNYRQWNVLTDKDNEAVLKKQMALISQKPLVDKFEEKSVVYEILLKEGFGINSVVIPAFEPGSSLEAWQVTDGERKMAITFAKKVAKEQVEALNLSENDFFVCLDSALDDTTKVNISRNLNVKVI